MTNEPTAWPEEQITLVAVSDWITSFCSSPAGPPEILRIKPWGVTARFGRQVFKASYTPLYPQVLGVHTLLEKLIPAGAPRLIASERVNGQLWTLFEHLPGITTEQAGTVEAYQATARELARVQAGVAALDLSGLPGIEVHRVPGLLLEQDLSDQPEALVTWLRQAQPALRADAEALVSIPPSLDHPDMNGSNAILLPDGEARILDWEEATIGCPLFSLDRLLDDAHQLAAVEPVREVYLATLGNASLEQLECAMRLVPLKLAYEFRAYARGLGWPQPHTRLTSRLLELAQKRSTSGSLPIWFSDLLASQT